MADPTLPLPLFSIKPRSGEHILSSSRYSLGQLQDLQGACSLGACAPHPKFCMSFSILHQDMHHYAAQLAEAGTPRIWGWPTQAGKGWV